MIDNKDVDWERLKVVIFDVDGTLYNQAKMRKKMLFVLAKHYVWQPWKIKEIRMLAHFRSEREHRAGVACPDLENAQYTWCAEKHGYSIPHLKQLVNHWMFIYPLRYLASCVYAGTKNLFAALRKQGIKIAIYSDYPAHDKLSAMGLKADLVISSTDPVINRLKPDPQGLKHIMSQLQVTPEECLFIGDRPELDGLCAQHAGMAYLNVDKDSARAANFYSDFLVRLSLIFKNTPYESRVYKP